MVFYFTSSEGHVIYMGKDKFENEDLIRYGFLEDVWFHVDDLSSAHVYLRLPLGQRIKDLSETCLEECAQLVKENSIEGCKKKSVDVVYTMWQNLKKTNSMEVGQVGFNHPDRVRTYEVKEKNRDILKALNKSKTEAHPDLEEERRQRELLYKSERKKQRQQFEAAERKSKEERKQQKELRSYSSLMARENIEASERFEASADLSSVNAYEEDFMSSEPTSGPFLKSASPSDSCMANGGMESEAKPSASPSAASGGDQTQRMVAQCLKMLAGSSDEHKFAGLLMITKLPALADAQRQELQRQVVDTVGVSFFLRLLLTKGPDAEDSSMSSFQTLGLNLIASFCQETSIAEAFAQEPLVRFVFEQLGSASVAAQAHEDCIHILKSILSTEKGANLVLQESILGRLFSALKKMTRNAASADKSSTTTYATIRAASLLDSFWSLVEALSTRVEMWEHIHNFDFEFICTNFAEVHGDVSIKVLAIFNNCTKLMDEGKVPLELLSSQCLSDIRVGGLRFLRAKWPHQERDACLNLICQLMRQAGTAWMLSGTTLRTQTPQDEVSGGKFVLFVLKLVAIEIKLMIDEIELALVQMEDKAVENADDLERQEKEVERALQVLPTCYGVVEMIITGLVANSEDELLLPYEILIEMKGTFNQIFVVVLEFLTLARDFMKTHRFREQTESQQHGVDQLHAVVYASIRVVSAWIAEDSDTGVDHVIDLVPFLVCYKINTHENAPEPSVLHAEDWDSDDEVDSDDEIEDVTRKMEQMISSAQHEATLDQLHFLLPGLLQISALPQGASTMLEDAEVLRRILGFCCKLCTDIAEGSCEYGSLPTLTLSLGILINLFLIGGQDDSKASSTGSSSIPNALEWFRALNFLLPVACASGNTLVAQSDLILEDRGDDDRYIMVLHAVCVVLLITGHLQDLRQPPCLFPPAVLQLVAPFNGIIDWLTKNPPDAESESTMDLFELVRMLSMRCRLTPKLFQ